MTTQMVNSEVWPARVHTKTVGTTFEGRQEILAECARQNVTTLRLVREPTNRYDPHAVAIEAEILDPEGARKTVQLGYVSNGDRVCADCGKVVGGALFERSRRLRCPDCDAEFGYSDPVVTAGPDGVPIVACPGCGRPVDIGLAKVVVCPGCGGSDFGRGGLATRLSRAMAAGVRYEAAVMEYTGGGAGRDGRPRSMGCNILVTRVDG